MTPIQPLGFGARPGVRRQAADADGSAYGKPATALIPPKRFRCSAVQRHIWMLDRLTPDSAVFNISARWQLEAEVSVLDLGSVFELLVARHPLLRTSLLEVDGELLQQVEPILPFHVSSIDLSGLGAVQAKAEAERLARLEAAAPFDIKSLPLLRVTHLQIAAQDSMLLLTAHQAICDAASLRLLVLEMSQAYSALRAGRTPRFQDLAISFGEHLDCLSRQHMPRLLRRDEAYWRLRLQELPYFELAADRPRPPVQTRDGDSRSLGLECAVSEALLRLSARAGSSLYVIALATLFTLLHRYSGESDIAIGSEVVGRDKVTLAHLIGPFVQCLVMRADLSGDPPFTDLMDSLRRRVLEAEEHASTPLDRLMDLLKPRRDPSRSPLYSIRFSFQPEIAGQGSSSSSCLQLLELPPCVVDVSHDLHLRMSEGPQGWLLTCEYNHALFEAATIDGLLRHFRNLLLAVGTDEACALSALPMLDEAERQRLLVEFNPPPTSYPHTMTVQALVTVQVLRTPEETAVVCGAENLSYRELEDRANRLSQWLCRSGVAAGDLVGVCLERSLDLPVALLAVLKAGAAYVPLDPAYPSLRLAQIVEDARPAAIVSTQSLLRHLPDSTTTLLLLDADAWEIEQQPAIAPECSLSPNDLAYVIFTSGSTGRPKGVQIPHRALCNFLCSMRREPGLTVADCLLSVTTISFDIAALELFLPLIVGAQVVIARADQSVDGSVLAQLLEEHQITVMQATPVTWQLLLAAGWRGDPTLKMLCGGEALSRRLAEQLLAQGGELWNLYGPTETTVWSSALRVQPGDGPVPIGPPIANTQFYVMDREAQILPLGVPGELYIGGDGVALGYLNQPALSRERFVVDRVRHNPGARLYRTGDRVRMHASGNLEFLGRGDQQIKLRGFRIELGEIEAALRQHGEVAEAIAMLQQDAQGEPSITAYIVAHAAPADSAAALISRVRASLRSSLPAYMCPSAILLLPQWPRMPNGKVDRTALALSIPTVAPARAASAPGNAIEQRLARIWRDELLLDWQSIDDNFFEIGGQSLLAVRLLARIEAEFGQRLSLVTLFRNPSIAGQARVLVEGDIQTFNFQQVLKLQAEGSRIPLIAINNTGIFYSLSKCLGVEQPFTSLQLFDPALPLSALPNTLEEIAAGYLQLIREVQPQGPYALLGWCVAGTLTFEIACQLRAAGHELAPLILFDSEAPGRLRRLPWLRRMLAEVSQRGQLIVADWVRAKRTRHRLIAFLENRETVKKLKRLLRRKAPAEAKVAVTATPSLSPNQYDQWLLHYLEDCAARYQPSSYPGEMLLFCSSQQPRGHFIDPTLGWGAFVGGGIELAVIEGDHFSIFREPAVSQMAERMEAVLRKVFVAAPAVADPPQP